MEVRRAARRGGMNCFRLRKIAALMAETRTVGKRLRPSPSLWGGRSGRNSVCLPSARPARTWQSRRPTSTRCLSHRHLHTRLAWRRSMARRSGHGRRPMIWETMVPKEWRRRRDSNPRYRIYQYDGLANRWFQPLTHVSGSQRRSAAYSEGVAGRQGVAGKDSWLSYCPAGGLV